MFNFTLTLQAPFARLESDDVTYEIICRSRMVDNEYRTPNIYFSVDILDSKTGRLLASSESRQYATGPVLVWEYAQNDN